MGGILGVEMEMDIGREFLVLSTHSVLQSEGGVGLNDLMRKSWNTSF